MLCPETSHNNNTVFVYVLTRRRVEEEVGNKGSGISVKVQRGGGREGCLSVDKQNVASDLCKTELLLCNDRSMTKCKCV